MVAPRRTRAATLFDLTPDLPLGPRVRRGAVTALAIAAAPCALLAAGALLAGPYVTSRGVEVDLRLGALLSPLAAAAAGAVAGAGLPFARTAVRAGALGAVVGVVALLGLALMFEPHAPDRWRGRVIVGVGGGVLLGHLVGVGLYALEGAGRARRAARRRRAGRAR